MKTFIISLLLCLTGLTHAQQNIDILIEGEIPTRNSGVVNEALQTMQSYSQPPYQSLLVREATQEERAMRFGNQKTGTPVAIGLPGEMAIVDSVLPPHVARHELGHTYRACELHKLQNPLIVMGHKMWATQGMTIWMYHKEPFPRQRNILEEAVVEYVARDGNTAAYLALGPAPDYVAMSDYIKTLSDSYGITKGMWLDWQKRPDGAIAMARYILPREPKVAGTSPEGLLFGILNNLAKRRAAARRNY